MVPSFALFLFALGILCWVVLPASVLVATVVCARWEWDDPLWVRQCRPGDPADPAAPGCWVPAGEYCPRHDHPGPRSLPDGRWERSVA